MGSHELKGTGVMDRREFVRNTTIGAAGLLAFANSGAANTPKDKILSYNENMEYRRLGKTDLMVSAVSLGGHWKRIDTIVPDVTPKLVWSAAIRNNADFMRNRDDVVGYCIDQGINYVDATNANEVMVYAKVLKGRRDKMYLGYSWVEKEPREKEWRTAKKLLQGLDEGMQEAGLDYIDLWRMSVLMPGSEHTFNEVYEFVEALDRAKQQGKVRFVGISSHDREFLKIMVDEFPQQMEVVLFPYTAMSKELPQGSLFEAVRKGDVGTFGIKPFASNSLFKGNSSPNSPEAEEDDRRARLAIRYILDNPAMTAPIPGLIDRHQVDNVVRAVNKQHELDVKEKAELRKLSAEAWNRLPTDYQWLKRWECV